MAARKIKILNTTTEIDFNKYFQPRPYQLDLPRALFKHNYKRIIRVGHRRYGKDTECWPTFSFSGLLRPGLYFYLLPTIGQARSVIWEGRGKDGVALIDRVPKQVIVGKPHETQMKIRLTNGSILHVTGADNYKAIVGTNPFGVVFSEYQQTDPRAWDLFLRPVLAENGGYVIFNGTPRGHNHFYELIEANRNNPDWFITVKTVEDTILENGKRVITEEAVQAERDAGMPEELIQQEFYCSFEAAIKGAYYAEQLANLRNNGRICQFDIDPTARVYTGWDIGVRDPSSVWLMQNVNGEWRLIYHIEESDRDLSYFIMRLQELKQKLRFQNWGLHFVPHDIAVREWGTGKTRLQQAREMGINLTPVNKIGSQQIRIIEGISVVRHNMPKMRIHSTNCAKGIRAIQEYHSTFDERKKTYTGPDHDWSSHAASSLATLCIGYMNQYDNQNLLRVRNYASYVPCS